MTADAAPFSVERSGQYRAILWGGLIAGALDLTAALVNGVVRGQRPIGILQAIASGLLGADSFKGGFTSAALGAVLHFIIAFAATAVYYLASRKLRFLVNRAIVCGLIYGVLVYLFMNLVVLPLSAVPFKPSYALASVVPGLIIHVLCVGLPISLAVRRYSTST